MRICARVYKERKNPLRETPPQITQHHRESSARRGAARKSDMVRVRNNKTGREWRKLIKTSKMSIERQREHKVGRIPGRRRGTCVRCSARERDWNVLWHGLSVRPSREWGYFHSWGGGIAGCCRCAARADVFWPERTLLWATDWSIGGMTLTLTGDGQLSEMVSATCTAAASTQQHDPRIFVARIVSPPCRCTCWSKAHT